MPVKLRPLLRSAAANFLHYSGAADSWRFFRHRALRRDEVCVLGLHRVLTKAEQSLSNSLDGMILTDVTFVRLLEYLQRRFHVVSLEALAGGEVEADKSKPWCLLTFDDGWRDTYTNAYPRLKSFGMPATVFLATGAIESRGGFWAEHLRKAWRIQPSRARMKSVLSQLDERSRSRRFDLERTVERLKHMSVEKRKTFLAQLLPPDENGESPEAIDCMLTWNEVVEMSRNRFEMGAHTVTHPLLTYENDTTVERELRLSKEILEEKLGKPVRALAYPNGDWDGRVRHWVEQLGYQFAFTTRPGWFDRRQDLYTIRRILLHEGNVTDRDGNFSPAMLSLTLAGRA